MRTHDAGDFQARLTDAFKQFRKWPGERPVARQWFSCCGGCASSEIAGDPKNHGRPSAFTHRQDLDGLDRGVVYVKYGWVHNSEREDAGEKVREDSEVVGRLFALAAEAAGLFPAYIGDRNECVVVFATAALRAGWLERNVASLREQADNRHDVGDEIKAAWRAKADKYEGLLMDAAVALAED